MRTLSARGTAKRGRKLRVPFYYVYVACLLGANAVLLMPARNFGQSGSNTLFTASWLVLTGFALLFLLSTINWRPGTLLFSLAVGGYVVAGTLWSVAPQSTFVYGGLLTANLLVAHMVAGDLGISQAVDLVGRTIFILCLIGILLYLIGLPQVFYYDAHGRPNILGGQPFRGLFVHKITAGLYASLGAAWAICGLKGLRRAGALFTFAVAVVLTGSTTGLVLAVLACGVSLLTLFAARRGVTRFSFFGLLGTFSIGAGAIILTNGAEMLGAVGRDATLTGRTDLWSIGLQTFAQRPIGGWGFKAYFESSYGDRPSQEVESFANYDVPHFHQSYIQTGVDLGAPGVLLIIGLVMLNLKRSYRAALAQPWSVTVAMFPMTVVLVIASTATFSFLTYNHFATFALFLFAYLLLKRDPKQLFRPKRVRRGEPRVRLTDAFENDVASWPRSAPPARRRTPR